MNLSWPDLQIVGDTTWEELYTLLEYDGPVLQVLARGGEKYLSVAVDFLPDGVRWIRSPISSTEEEALKRGAASVRSCIEGRQVWIVDSDHQGATLKSYRAEAAMLPNEALPNANSFLPSEVVSSLSGKVALPSFRLDGPALESEELPFNVLGEVTTSLQRLWNALGQLVEGSVTTAGKVPESITSRAEIRLSGFASGSAILQIHSADDEMFDRVATRFAGITRDTADERATLELLRSLPARVRSAYIDLARSLSSTETELLATWGNKAAHISPYSANRVRELVTVGFREYIESLTVYGYFSEFDTRGEFRFHDRSNDEVYEGRLSDHLIRKLEDNVSVGAGSMYEASISIFETSAVAGDPRLMVLLEGFQLISVPKAVRG